MAKRGREGVELPVDQGKTLRLDVSFRPLELTTKDGDIKELRRLKDPIVRVAVEKPADAVCEKEKLQDFDTAEEREKAEYERLIREIQAEDSLFQTRISYLREQIQAFSQSSATVSSLKQRLAELRTQYQTELQQETEACAAQIKAKDQFEDKLKRVGETERRLEEEAAVLGSRAVDVRKRTDGFEADNAKKEREIAILKVEASYVTAEIVERLRASEALGAKVAEENTSLEALRREIAQYSGIAA
jgi:chromosome segregation ATPase